MIIIDRCTNSRSGGSFYDTYLYIIYISCLLFICFLLLFVVFVLFLFGPIGPIGTFLLNPGPIGQVLGPRDHPCRTPWKK